MILEGVVTTEGPAGVNIAPMGPMVDEDFAQRPDSFVLRPFKSSRTYANLKANPEGVLHVTDDVLLIASAVIASPSVPLTPARVVRGSRLVDCCRAYEFQIERFEEQEERTRLTAKVIHLERVRDFWGFNRAKHAVLEMAILASRVTLLPRAHLLAECDRLRTPMEKTAGTQEREAFTLLENYIRSNAR